MDYVRFRNCIDILRQSDASSVRATKAALEDQVATLLIEQGNVSAEAKQTAMNAAKSNTTLSERIVYIRDNELSKYQEGLRSQQQKGIQSKSSLLLVARIVEKRKEMDRLQRNIDDAKLKASAKAKTLSHIMNQITSFNQEISLLSDALVVDDYLITYNLLIGEITDFELERIYRTFSLEV